MKKLLLSLFASGLIAGTASAATYWDSNPADTWFTALTPSYTGEFTISGVGPGKGFDPFAEVITSASVEFLFGDPFGGTEAFKVEMSGIDFFTQGSFSGSLTLGDTLFGNALIDLQDDGKLSYTVTLTGDNWLSGFWLDNAYLEASTRAVPDSASVVGLLGASLIGLSILRRKR